MKRKLKNILITGGAGFIGSNFIHYIFEKTEFDGVIVNVDKLSYAGNLENLKTISEKYEGKRYFFEHTDICNFENIKAIFTKYDIDTVVNFSAETHVDRSILGPEEFIQTNIVGTYRLLEVARLFWKDRADVLFHHISTDEVYGSLGKEGYFYEDTRYNPSSPYSASKSASDHIINAYHKTFGIPITISNCSNNYGAYQFPEKLIPLMILNIKQEKSLPIYGDGKNIRDWLFVEDHNNAVWLILNKGRAGQNYNIGGDNEWENIKLVNVICEKMADIIGKNEDYYKRLITFVKDRPGHDKRYAVNCSKIKRELNWKQNYTFSEGLDMTIKWYLENEDWVNNVISGEYRKWIEKHYG